MIKESKDIWFNAFMLKCGHKIVSFKVDMNKKVSCCFLVSDDDWSKMKLEFQSSEINQFKGYLNQIRDLGY